MWPRHKLLFSALRFEAAGQPRPALIVYLYKRGTFLHFRPRRRHPATRHRTGAVRSSRPRRRRPLRSRPRGGSPSGTTRSTDLPHLARLGPPPWDLDGRVRATPASGHLGSVSVFVAAELPAQEATIRPRGCVEVVRSRRCHVRSTWGAIAAGATPHRISSAAFGPIEKGRDRLKVTFRRRCPLRHRTPGAQGCHPLRSGLTLDW